jgi:tetratricopeptide (TPR) repeat protein
MLGREDEARGEFHKAIAVDEFRLAHAHRDEERFAALKSMGETYFDLGDYGSAVGRFEEAYGTTLDRRNRLHIQTWLGRANQAALLEEQRTR